LSHFLRAFAVFAADRVSAVVLTDFSREDAKANKRDRVQWTKNSNRSIMVRNLFHLNFAASRLRVKPYFVP
jgi:hypothetical protein